MVSLSNKETYDDIFEHLDNLSSGIREEFDEHLDAINENTEEISIQNSAICEIDNRLNKLEEKLDKVHFMFKQMLSRSVVSVDLSKDEQKVFLMLYTHEGFLSANDICDKSDIDKSLVEESLMALMDKGIPVEREILNKGVYFRLGKEFKLRQAKEEMVHVDHEIKQQFQNSLLKQFFAKE